MSFSDFLLFNVEYEIYIIYYQFLLNFYKKIPWLFCNQFTLINSIFYPSLISLKSFALPFFTNNQIFILIITAWIRLIYSKKKKKIPRLQELRLTVEGTLLLPSRDPDDTLCALDNKEKNELVSQRLDDGSIPDNVILLYREILFTKFLEDYEEKEKKMGAWPFSLFPRSVLL